MGWEPTEQHTTSHGIVTVTREPEWDDYERDKMLALELYESEVCECGFHKSIAHDPDQWFDLESVTCPLCADIAARMRSIAKSDQAEDDALKEKPGKKRTADGRRWFTKWRAQ